MTSEALDRRAVRRAFDRAAEGYGEFAVLQREIETRLLERVDYFDLRPERILDLGCGPGTGSLALARRFPDARVTALDWSLPMLRAFGPGQAGHAKPERVCADMQALPLRGGSFDLVFSNLALQWSSDLGGAFAGLRRVLRPGGLLLFSTFGPDTLHELRAAWQAADERPHVNRFIDLHEIGDLVAGSGLREPVMDMEHLTLEYPDALSLMRELKAIGAHNAAQGRARALTGKARLRAVLDAYESYRRDGRYPATYEVVYGAAFGPEEGQPIRAGGTETATFSPEHLAGSRRHKP